jgi:hypothetical protein
MTDVLLERFAALADTHDDGDWLDVRRRARRWRRLAVPAAVVAAAAVAAAAVAATGGWLFTSHDRQVTAVTHVALHGQTWRVAITTGGRLRVCVRLSHPGSLTVSAGCGGSATRPLPPPFGARSFDVAGGQIWVGTTIGSTRRIAITDASGHVHTGVTTRAPRGAKTPFRYWAIALDSSTARSIAAFDPRGRVIRKTVG